MHLPNLDNTERYEVFVGSIKNYKFCSNKRAKEDLLQFLKNIWTDNEKTINAKT